jgi:hypothetical protein
VYSVYRDEDDLKHANFELGEIHELDYSKLPEAARSEDDTDTRQVTELDPLEEIDRLATVLNDIIDDCTLKSVFVGNFYKEALKKVKARATEALYGTDNASKGFYLQTEHGTAHVLGDPDMSQETLGALGKLIEAAYKAVDNGEIEPDSD